MKKTNTLRQLALYLHPIKVSPHLIKTSNWDNCLLSKNSKAISKTLATNSKLMLQYKPSLMNLWTLASTYKALKMTMTESKEPRHGYSHRIKTQKKETQWGVLVTLHSTRYYLLPIIMLSWLCSPMLPRLAPFSLHSSEECFALLWWLQCWWSSERVSRANW